MLSTTNTVPTYHPQKIVNRTTNAMQYQAYLLYNPVQTGSGIQH